MSDPAIQYEVWPEPGHDMAWAKPQFSRAEIDRAGALLLSGELADRLTTADVDWEAWGQYEHALEVINNWRSSHSYALQSMKMGLIHRAKRVDQKGFIVAQRIKRLSSIEIKLRRNQHMKLTQMQDLGGCRAIVRSAIQLQQLVRIYNDLEFAKKYDYIAAPKSDGYRGVHFVRKYASNLSQNQIWIGLRIETQLRTRMQHAWATAVETVDTFSKQQIKTGAGDQKWRRFFVLMSSFIALREGGAIAPGSPANEAELKSEVRELVRELQVLSVLTGWMTAMQQLPARAKAGTQAFLLVLRPAKHTLRISPFTDDESAKASEEYLRAEKEIQQATGEQAVLVSVKSVRGLQAAFPNYFADTRTFIQMVERAISG